MDYTLLIITIILIIIVFALIVRILKCYKKCPADRVLVIYGKTGTGNNFRCIHGGTAFVYPILQDYAYLDLTPFTLSIDLRNALTKENIRVNILSSFTLAISTDPNLLPNAAERLLNKKLFYVQSLAQDIIIGQMRLLIATMSVEELNSNCDKFIKEINKDIETELNKIGITLINATITNIMDESGFLDALANEATVRAINEAKIRIAKLEMESNLLEKERLVQKAIQETETYKRKQIDEALQIAEKAKQNIESAKNDTTSNHIYQLTHIDDNTISIQKDSKTILKIEFAHQVGDTPEGFSGDSSSYLPNIELFDKSSFIVQRQSKNLIKVGYEG